MKTELKEFKMTYAELELNDGIIVKSRIPYADKEKMAVEYIEGTLGVDADLGICYTIYSADLVWNYLFMKYYTNIDVEGAEDMTVLYDYAEEHELMGSLVGHHVGFDLSIVSQIAEKYKESIVRLYEKGHSLEQQAKKFLSTDVDTNIAETRELIEKLTDMKGALLEKEEQGKVLQFGKKKSANVTAGGVKLNLSKK